MRRDPKNFQRAMSRFNSMHGEDPETVIWQGSEYPRSCLYHERLSYWIEQLDEHASAPLRLAGHCQHLRRWVIPRADYPDGLTGYRRWRKVLSDFHAQEASTTLRDVGYDDTTISRVRDFLIKRNLQQDPEIQLFEDAICLVFFETEFADFAEKHSQIKIIRILRKVWLKMSERGREIARQVVKQMPKELHELLDDAVSEAK